MAAAVDKRQREFATGRRLAHGLLTELGVGGGPLLPGRDRAPIWPDGVVGTISHSRAWCVVAAARGRVGAEGAGGNGGNGGNGAGGKGDGDGDGDAAHGGARRGGAAWDAPGAAPAVRGSVRRFTSLGIDVEPATPLEAKLWRHVLLPCEQAWLATVAQPLRGVTGKLIFSAKETVYKAIAAQLGELIGFLDVEVTVDAAGERFHARLVDEARAARVPRALAGRYAVLDEGVFTAMALSTAS